jgi:hypothetical protein
MWQFLRRGVSARQHRSSRTLFALMTLGCVLALPVSSSFAHDRDYDGRGGNYDERRGDYDERGGHYDEWRGDYDTRRSDYDGRRDYDARPAPAVVVYPERQWYHERGWRAGFRPYYDAPRFHRHHHHHGC